MPSSPRELPEFSVEDFERFRQLLLEKCGMYFDDNKLGVIRNAVQDRMVAGSIADYQNYYRMLTEPSQTRGLELDAVQSATGYRSLGRELRRLIESLAVNETAFFRNKEHYRAIGEEVLPRLFRRHAVDRRIRIWSAGCSTGQEPYSLAMTVQESLQKAGLNPANWKIEIVASDISERALRVAQSGRYRSDEMRGMTPEQIATWFRSLSAPSVATAPLDPADIIGPGRVPTIRHRPQVAFEVSPQVREMVKFYFFNLVTPTFPDDKFHHFDLILCENVTIYFTPEITRQIIHNLGNTMNDGGFLFIGYSETLWQVSDRFKLINTQETFYYQKPFPNEEPTRYARHQPLTGPLSDQAPRTAPSGILPQTTDQLRLRRTDNSARTDPVFRRVSPAIPKKATDDLPTPTRSGPVPLPTKSRPDELLVATANLETRSWRELLDDGKELLRDHQFDRALISLEQAQVLSSHQPEIMCALADIKLKLGDYKGATELCQRVIGLDNLSEAAHLMLAMIHHREGKLDRAIEEFRRTIYINIDSEIAHMRLGDIYRDMGKRNDALREYKHALSLLKQKGPEEIIEDLSVGLLVQACQLNINRLTPRAHRQ